MHGSLRLGTSAICTPFKLAIESRQVMILIGSAETTFAFFQKCFNQSLEYLRF